MRAAIQVQELLISIAAIAGLTGARIVQVRRLPGHRTRFSLSQRWHCAWRSSQRIFRQLLDMNAPSGLLTRVEVPQEHQQLR